MRTLYFDIDGTLLTLDTGLPKAGLASGRFERAVRRASISKLVCIGNFAEVVRLTKKHTASYDALGALFGLCAGVFEDEEWLRATAELTPDPQYRAANVDLGSDWWYTDDLAEDYFRFAGREHVFQAHLGGRILVPSPSGDGSDVLDWIESIESYAAR